MSFAKVVCWKQDMVEKVMETEALQTEDHVFLATHHPVRLHRHDLVHTEHLSEAPRLPYDQEQLLKDFLAPTNYVFVAILGASGSGKSHLVRWLSLRVPTSKKRKLLLIPKIGANLRDIIGLMLKDMKGRTFDRFRDKLKDASSRPTEEQARELLLFRLAFEAGSTGDHDPSELTPGQSYVMRHVKDFLVDAHFRPELLAEGGVLYDLADHVFATDKYERREEPRAFTVEDLPLDVTHVGEAARKASDFYRQLLGHEDVQKETVAWLNHCLPAAIKNVLNFSGQDLQSLMTEVRLELARQDKELVVLVEDFAKLQGVDLDLLEALLVRPQQHTHGRLCAMRVALAVTEGYYNSFPDTVKTRIKFRVSTDIPMPHKGDDMTQQDLFRFAARYLNAGRLNEKTIRGWAETGRAERHEPLVSACDGCVHRQTCHGAFGSVDGVGLYPFSRQALTEIAGRLCPETFNPRDLIDMALRHTLESYAGDLVRGVFPSAAFHRHFGGVMRADVLVRQDLERQDAEHAPQRLALLDLWGVDEGGLRVHPAIYSAFGLQPLAGEVAPKEEASDDERAQPDTRQAKPTPASKPAAKRAKTAIDGHVALLEQWRNGQTKLPQNLVTLLRDRVLRTIENNVDWDAEGLIRLAFIGNKPGLFYTRCINFENQELTETPQSIQLRIACTTGNALALRGLLEFERHGHWRFDGGERMLRTYASQIRRWSEDVLRQIRSPLKSGKEWDPTPATAELLAVAACMSGQVDAGTSVADVLSAVFADPARVDVGNRSEKWKRLSAPLREHQEKLLAILTARVGCTKGGSQALKIIDAGRLEAPLRAFVRTGHPKQKVPEELRSRAYGAIAAARSAVDELLAGATADEKARYRDWYDRTATLLGSTPDMKELVSVLQEALQQTASAGVCGGPPIRELEHAGNVARKIDAAEIMQHVAGLLRERKPFALLCLLGRDISSEMVQLDGFLQAVCSFLSGTEDRITQEIGDLEHEGSELAELKRGIGEGFRECRKLLQQMAE